MKRYDYVSGEYMRPKFVFSNLDGINLYVGGRATGKTTLLADFAQKFHAEGRRVVVLFPTQDQARRFQRDHLRQMAYDYNAQNIHVASRATVDSMRGVYAEDLLIDEWDENEEMHLDHWYASVAGCSNPRVIIMSNQDLDIRCHKKTYL